MKLRTPPEPGMGEMTERQVATESPRSAGS
jgi:hypothetical protein